MMNEAAKKHNPGGVYPLYYQPNYSRIAEYCNIWRNYDDIQDSWQSLSGIVKFYGDDKTNFTQVAGPGHFNDPDMVQY